MLIDDYELISDFVVESNERLVRVEQLVLRCPSSDRAADQTALNEIYREFHTLKGNASFIGLSNVVDLCHGSETLLKDILEGQKSWELEIESFFLAVIDRLRGILSDPEGSIDQSVSDILGFLKPTDGPPTGPEFLSMGKLGDMALEALPEVESGDPVATASDIAPLLGKREEQVTLSKPVESGSDSDVYRICLLKSQRCAADNPDQWLAYRLMSLSLLLTRSTQLGTFSECVLDELRAHDAFRNIDRICLVANIPNTNRITVLDSKCSKSVSENLLAPGYSCYVNPCGSLFQLKPGMLRIFNRAGSVVDSFRRERRPVQRSIGKIAAMGMKSGLCLALGINDSTEGFLFANSKQENFFSDVDSRYPFVLSYLGMLGRVELLRHGYGRVANDKTESGVPFSASQFLTHLKREMQENSVSVAPIHLVERHDCDFLCEPGKLSQIICRILQELRTSDGSSGARSEIHVGLCGSRVAFRLLHAASSDAVLRIVPLLSQLNLLHGYQVHVSDKVVSIDFPFEQVSESLTGNYYSVL